MILYRYQGNLPDLSSPSFVTNNDKVQNSIKPPLHPSEMKSVKIKEKIKAKFFKLRTNNKKYVKSFEI